MPPKPPANRLRAPAAATSQLTTSSRAEATAPDVSLTDAGGAYSHKGLTYPLGRRGPETGELIDIAPGVGWARLPVPGALKHINIWVLEDEGGVAIVDTGLDIPQSREAWEALFAGPLAGKTVTRVICTHFHPDHLG
ncbi:MAG: MBL fold metallo-hydrolase, partial [Alphaproteobacteria bacterium]